MRDSISSYVQGAGTEYELIHDLDPVHGYLVELVGPGLCVAAALSDSYYDETYDCTVYDWELALPGITPQWIHTTSEHPVRWRYIDSANQMRSLIDSGTD